MAFKTIHICDHCKKEFEELLPSATIISITPDLCLQVSARHNHCAYDMCNNCRVDLLKAYVKKLDNK